MKTKDNTLEILTIQNEIFTLLQKAIDLRNEITEMEDPSDPFYVESCKKVVAHNKTVLDGIERQIKTKKSRIFFLK